MINISVESQYDGYSRFEMIAMCGGFDEGSERVYVVSAQKGDGESFTQLEADAAHHIEVIIYFVPKALPQGKNCAIADHPTFEAEVKISSDTKEIYNAVHQINAWGGAAIKLQLNIE
ncbi:MAG: hypothetical protein R3Y44_02135 [Rikenellaceae bacterium]